MNILRRLHEHGLSGVWSIIKVKFLKINYHRAHYLRLVIDIDKTNALLKDFDLEVKELSFEDFLLGDPSVFKGKKLERYKQRFLDHTYKAYGIIEDGKLIYSTWISLHRLGMSVETEPVYLLPNEGYLEDSYCAPQARGRGLHSKMNNYRIKKIYETGKSRVIAIVIEGNTPAFKVQFKSGFEELGTFYHGYFFGVRFNTLNKMKFDNL